MNNAISRSLLALCLSTLITLLPAAAQAQDVVAGKAEDGSRMMAITIDAVITDVDQENREVTLRSPMGDLITITAGDHIKRLEDFSVGDIVSTTYIASLEGELREPTEEEKANPWVELEGAAIANEEMDPGAIVGRTIQAVCTIEGMNRLTGTVTVLDPRVSTTLLAMLNLKK